VGGGGGGGNLVWNSGSPPPEPAAHITYQCNCSKEQEDRFGFVSTVQSNAVQTVPHKGGEV